MADPFSFALTVGLTAANYALTASQTIEGPRLKDLSVTPADYGTQFNYFLGVMRFDSCPVFYAEPLREEKVKRKTKGGKYNEYKYYGTWANSIADQQIDAVTRVWADRHLIFQRTHVGPASAATSGDPLGRNSPKKYSNYRLYFGTEDQEPDPRMLAKIEEREGAGSCPAYRGHAYIMYDDVPLEKFGNRIPQVSIEAVSLSTPTYPFERIDTPINVTSGLIAFTFSRDYSYFGWLVNGNEIVLWDTAARTPVGTATTSMFFSPTPRTLAISQNGRVYIADGTSFTGNLWSVDPFTGSSSIVAELEHAGHAMMVTTGDNQEIVGIVPTPGFESYAIQLITVTGVAPVAVTGLSADLTAHNWMPSFYFTDSHGDAWACGSGENAGEMHLYRIANTGVRPGSDGFARFTGLGHGSNIEVVGTHYNGHFILEAEEVFYKIDEDTMTIVDSVDHSALESHGHVGEFYNLPPGSATVWFGWSEISLDDLSLIRTLNPNDWTPIGGTSGFQGTVYDPINHAIIVTEFNNDTIVWYYLDRISADGLTKREVIEHFTGIVGVEDIDRDASPVTGTVSGVSWVQGSAKSILGSWLEAWDIDARPHDFQVQFLPRGSASGATIDVAEFVRREDNRYRLSGPSEEDLPLLTTLTFSDVDKDHQENTAESKRSSGAVDTKRILSLDMRNMAMDVDEARQYVDRHHRRKWYESERLDNVLRPRRLALEPGDVVTFTLDGITRTERMVKMSIGADSALSCEWKRDNPSVASLNGVSGAPMDGRDNDAIFIPGLTRGFALDVPLAIDADDESSPFLYVVAGPISSATSWTGADFFVSDDGDPDTYDAGFAAISSDRGMDWGYATEALGDCDPWVKDDGPGVEIVMKSGTLTTVTEDELLADARLNLALFGQPGRWEYIQFQTATLTGTDTYQLTGLIRGARGTEQYVGSHESGDYLILVDNRAKANLGASEIGDTDWYKPVTQGRDPSSGFPQEIAFTAAPLRPYSPVHGELTKDAGSGDWTIDAVRRTRLGGFNVYGQTPPLGETSESWEADIMDGDDVLRTISGTSLPLTYTDAQATTDFGSNPSSLTVNLYQISPALDLRGFPLELAA